MIKTDSFDVMTKMVAILVLIPMVHFHYEVDGLVLSSSRLERCIQSDEIKCEQKMIITLSITAGSSGTESFETSVTSVESEDGKQILAQPWQIRVVKNKARAIYPISYVSSVDHNPHEEIIFNRFSGILLDSCKDGNVDDFPTCGWAFNAAGNKIPYSQGFCCSCSLFDDNAVTRSGLNCDLFQFARTSSAHCLRYFYYFLFSSFSIFR